MATFVLVGGAWLGAWVWRDVTRLLRSRGHDVFPATLTGLADRGHLANPSVDLDTHITDVVRLMEFEDVADAVLVGHSYSGSVITGVADRAADRLALLVFCDSAPLADGQSMLDFYPLDVQAQIRKQVDEDGQGWLLPPPAWGPDGHGASMRGLGEREFALLRSKATPQPFATYTQRLRLERMNPPMYRRSIILCDDGKCIMAAARASLDAGESYFSAVAGDDWEFRELETGHWPMLSAPADLAAVLDDLATARQSSGRPHSG